MGVEKISIERFVALSKQFPVIDVRSEAEFQHAHIPGAHNLPLFNNDERKVVGTIYKQQSRELAIKKGLEYFGPKMKDMIVFAEKINAKLANENKTFLVHCWRGGMRSAGVAWLLDLYSFKVYTLVGGYKSFRNWVLEQFEKSWKINIVGGYTGSGKTIVLEELVKAGEAVVDLEGIAGHRGSAFGRIGLPEQTSVEMFENKLAIELSTIEKKHADKHIWMEDESQRIGAVSIPYTLWTTMRKSMVYFLEIPFEQRLAYLTETYGKMDREELAGATTRIQKKLGGLETKTALQHLDNNDIGGCFNILLKYYDKLYHKSLLSREEFHKENTDGYKKEVISAVVDPVVNAKKLMNEFYGRN
ncbi:MAG: tRNA 2-selenouridine(34) synthase MnmH [Chitinophagia bacterium]